MVVVESAPILGMPTRVSSRKVSPFAQLFTAASPIRSSVFAHRNRLREEAHVLDLAIADDVAVAWRETLASFAPDCRLETAAGIVSGFAYTCGRNRGEKSAGKEF
jgi:hypothetical protein